MKTRDKIVLAALELFNKNGERNVTTNHIAAHLSISTGNLYYHFHNKEEIIREIFESYSIELLETFTPMDLLKESLVPFKLYLKSIFKLMWKYRFFYANLPQILQRDDILHEKYLAVQEKSRINLRYIFKALIGLKFLDIEEDEVASLITSLHLVSFSWLSYQSAMTIKSDITEQVIYQGMLQMTALMKRSTTARGKQQVLLLEEWIKK